MATRLTVTRGPADTARKYLRGTRLSAVRSRPGRPDFARNSCAMRAIPTRALSIQVESASALLLKRWSHFLTENRCPPPPIAREDGRKRPFARGHAFPEIAPGNLFAGGSECWRSNNSLANSAPRRRSSLQPRVSSKAMKVLLTAPSRSRHRAQTR